MATNLYTDSEIKEMRDFLNSITTHIPEDKAGYVWNSYKKINNTNENQPCTCGSAAQHWRKAIDSMKNYIKGLDTKTESDNDNGSNG